jgi:hypothetical protein
MDGMFLGTQEASQDPDFLFSNKVLGIVNCAGATVPNSLGQYGIRYLTFRWFNKKDMVMFSSKGRNLARIVKFIDRVRTRGGSVLIHSAHGTGRGVYAAMAYFMTKFCWSVGKVLNSALLIHYCSILRQALEYVDSKRPGVCPKPMFLKQLSRAAGLFFLSFCLLIYLSILLSI